MATLVSTGQFTITDHNDAVSITSFLNASRGVSQVFANNDGTNVFVPDWTSGGNQVLTAYAYAGAGNIAANLSNRKWSADSPEGTSLGSGVTYTISTNLLTEASPTKTYYFQGDYTDPVTGLVSHIINAITFTLTKKGDAAVFVQLDGQTVINKSSTSVQASCQVQAGLYRNAGTRDTTAVSYKWYKIVAGSPVALVSGQADVSAGNVVFKNDAGTAQSAPTDFAAACTQLEVKENAVNDIQLFKVEVKDTNTNTVYGLTFAVYDVSDPYDVAVASTAGDKFQNGQGTTNLSPVVKNGAQVTDITGWSFLWTLYDKDGVRSGFVDTDKTPSAKTISANTTTSFTISVALAAAPAAGSLVKVVNSAGTVIRVYEVGASSTTTVINIRTTGLTNSWASTTTPTASEFASGKLFCVLGTKSTSGSTAVTVTGDDIDVKGTIYCEASKPI
jgi:hypothetical protein